MNAKNLYLLMGIVLIVGFLPQGYVLADTGPKSSMDFEFVQEVAEPELTIVSGVLYFCEQPDCDDAQVVPEAGHMGPYGFSCTDRSCHASYGGTYYQLEVTFSDGKIRKSNIFEKSYFNAKYKVRIKSDSLSVEELEGYDSQKMFAESIAKILAVGLLIVGGIILGPILIIVPIMLIQKRKAKNISGLSNFRLGSCLLGIYLAYFILWGLIQSYRTFLSTLVVELSIALVYLMVRRIQVKKMLWAIFIANVFSQPVLYFLVSRMPDRSIILIVGELLVWLTESILIYYLQQRQLSFRHIMVLAFVLNATSFGIGYLLPI